MLIQTAVLINIGSWKSHFEANIFQKLISSYSITYQFRNWKEIGQKAKLNDDEFCKDISLHSI